MSWPKARPVWLDRELKCVGCAKKTWRPLASQRPCEWCKGELFVEATDAG